MKKQLVTCVLLLSFLFIFPVEIQAADSNAPVEIKSIDLPKPVTEGGKPLMEALKERKSTREFSDEKLSLQTLSNMLWAANGISRPDGKRTAPSARNKQEIDIYVAMEDGTYLYDAKENKLIGVVAEDIREATGMQPFVKNAPVNLLFVADYDKMGDGSNEQKDFYAATDTGYVSQNVYLFCASEGLATVVRGMVDRDKCKAALKLKDSQKIILAQTVGYPKR
ncbi:MAG: nitroreductase A [Planctomycetes bacterium ADurb.Bin401]|nr:MAG: nitroreductase A [Planctomycetes bacterium ADurb.Bin401]